MSEEGIYRVSGSEKEVKALKERFLRGRGIPVLANSDIHVICGCIKDFLRNLREPLIPTRLWTSFSNAAQNHDNVVAVRDLCALINQLPQANRDTLAYLILHLQRLVHIIIRAKFQQKYFSQNKHRIYNRIIVFCTRINCFYGISGLHRVYRSKCQLQIWPRYLVQLWWAIQALSPTINRFSPKQ